MISFKQFSILMMLGGGLMLSLLMGGLAWSELPALKEALPSGARSNVNTDLQELMNWMKHLNLSPTAKTSSDQSFERFFDLKSQGDAHVHMMEKATAFKQGTRQAPGSVSAPKKSHHRSF
jgi:hypothetical protein